MSTHIDQVSPASPVHPLEVWRQTQVKSVDEAAKAIGTSRVNWYRLLGGAQPRADLATRIANVAGVSRAQLGQWADSELCS